MPNQFTCPNCRHAHRFLAALAGQTMHCHGCGFVFRIPLVPLGRTEGVDFSLAGRWLLRLAGGRQFGPVRRETILEWLREGRADADCLVAPEDGAKWYRVTDVFPNLPVPETNKTHDGSKTAAGTGTATATGTGKKGKSHGSPNTSAGTLSLTGRREESLSPASVIPAAGLLDLLEDCADEPPRGRLRAIQRDHAEALKSLETEAARAAGFLRPRGAKLVWLEEERAPRYARGHEPLEPEAATVAAYQGPQGGEFYCIIPWSRLGRMPHEFLSILPGRLPGPVALRRAHEEAFEGGCWIGITGDDRDVMAHAAAVSREALSPQIEWEWRSENQLYQMILVWGVQAVPLGPEKFAHLVQTAERPESGAPAGLRWYLERQSAFWRFARRLNLPGTPGSPVLFASCGAQLLTLAADRLRNTER